MSDDQTARPDSTTGPCGWGVACKHQPGDAGCKRQTARPDDVEALAGVIRSVTDLWDEPLDEVHDVPPIVNAVIAAGWASPAALTVLAADTWRMR